MRRKKLNRGQQDLMDKIIELYKKDKVAAIVYLDKYYRYLCDFLPLADPEYNLLGFIFDDLKEFIDKE